MENLKPKVFSGLGWNMLGNFGNQLVSILVTMVLVRLLSPAEFGLIAMITVFTAFSTVLVDFGFGTAIIQKAKLSEQDRSSIFWLNLLVGILITLSIIGLAGPIAGYYGEPRLKPLAIFISLSYLFRALSIVQNALYARALDFKVLILRGLISNLISGATAIVLALNGWGVWSIAVQIVLQSLLSSVLIWIVSPWKPVLIFSMSSVRAVFSFSSSIFFRSSLNYFSKNLDNFLIGKYLGKVELGLYSKSFSFITLPTKNIAHVLTKVMLPSYSRMQHDPERVSRLYLKVNRFVFFLTCPLMIIIFISAEPFILFFFGPKWIDMLPLVKIFVFSGILNSLESLINNVLVSTGNAGILFQDGLLKKGITIAGILIGLQWGLVGVATGKLTSDVINLFISFYFTRKAISVRVKTQINNLVGIALLNTLIALIVYLSHDQLKDQLPGSFFELAVNTSVYLGLYLLLGTLFNLSIFHELYAVFKERKQLMPGKLR